MPAHFMFTIHTNIEGGATLLLGGGNMSFEELRNWRPRRKQRDFSRPTCLAEAFADFANAEFQRGEALIAARS
jgi:hypothetical protein